MDQAEKPKKFCKRCDVYYPHIAEYWVNLGGVLNYCRICKNKSNLKYMRVNKDKYAKMHRKWLSDNREQENQKAKKRRDGNPEWERIKNIRYREKKREYSKKYYRDNIDKIKEDKKRWAAKQRREKTNYAIASALRIRLYAQLKLQKASGSHVKNLGCSISELREYLKSKFEPGMSWSNWGRYGWHIDHIIPLSSFDLNDPEQLKKACHYTNLQPLWWKENLSKGGRNGSG